LSKKRTSDTRVPNIMDTPARQRLREEIGLAKVNELETLITAKAEGEHVILETPARKRLRKQIGEQELLRIEARILKGGL